MDTSKIIKGVVGGGRYTVTASITQWDYGYIFQPIIDDLPATYRLDFANDEHHGTALSVYCGADGGEVPEELIDTGKDIFVWFFYIGDGFGKTEYKWRIPNKCKPRGGGETPEPSQQSSIDQLISVANEAIDTAQESASQASASAQSAGQSAISADESAQSAQQSLTALTEYGDQAIQELIRITEEVNTSASNASDYAEASAQSAQSAEQSAQTASDKADSIHSMTASAQTLPEGSSASASYDAQTGEMTFGIPKGDKGDKGDTGATGAKGEQGERGPQGVQGERGPQGPQGDDYILTEQDKRDIAELVDAGGMVVNATLVSGTQYSIDSTYDAIKTALSAGKTVVVMTGGVPQPYVGNVQLNGEWYLAFGVSTIYDNIAMLTGFMIPQTYQNVAVWTAQNTTIPQLNDVQINGTSIVTDGVAEIPVASTNRLGVMRTASFNGTQMMGEVITIVPANSSDIKNGSAIYHTVSTTKQHESAFYGLAKSAGDTTQSQSSNAVGVYTDEAKIAIQKMLGIYEAPWELIREDTFTNAEEADHIIDVDANGEPFELTDARIIFWTPSQETIASKKDSGRITFVSGSDREYAYLGEWTQQAGAASRIGLASVEQKCGMIETHYIRNTYDPNSAASLSAPCRTNNAWNHFVYDPSGRVYTQVIITKVLGTGSYRLYGRRKWQ